MAKELVMKIICLQLLLSLSVQNIRGDVTTLRNEKVLTCVSSENILESVIHADPPIKQGFLKPWNSTITFEWTKTKNDWFDNIEDSFFPGPVTDKRWQDFPTNHTDYLKYDRKDLSFSVYSSTIFGVFVTDGIGSSSVSFEFKKQGTGRWEHYSVIYKSNKIYVEHNFNIISKNAGFPAEQIVLKSAEPLFWKIHDYDYKWSKEISPDTAGSIKITVPTKAQLVIFASLCQWCSLDVLTIISETKPRTTTIKPDIVNTSISNSWKKLLIDIEPNYDHDITFYRQTTNNERSGEWAIDLKLWDNVLEIDKINLPADNSSQYVCKTLSGQESTDVEKCTTGFIGPSCNVSCQSALELEFCDEHSICGSSGGCVCAWGYQGTPCNQACSNNTWGLSCKSTCKQGCQCNSKTGICRSAGNAATARFGVMLTTLAFMYILQFLY